MTKRERYEWEAAIRRSVENGDVFGNHEARFLIAQLDEKWADCKMLADQITIEQDRQRTIAERTKNAALAIVFDEHIKP